MGSSLDMQPSDIEISVLLITYNHAPFVRQAVESVLRQKTSRPWELIISEDASTDGTLDVVRSAVGGDPRVRYLVSETNLHSNESVARAIRAARGRYVSIIDGDDYWIVDDKLERQAAILDAEPQLSACFHNGLVLEGDASEPSDRRWTPSDQRETMGIEQIWQGNPYAAFAGMIRRDALAGIGTWYSELTPMITDWPLYALCAEHGDLRFVDEPVGVYRLHEHGQFSSLSTRAKLDSTAALYRALDAGLDRRHHREAISGASTFFVDRAEVYLADGERSLARRCLRHALRAGGLGAAVSWRRWLGLSVRALR
jgi:glycosyltransferase involved in cell wall biosynthesis